MGKVSPRGRHRDSFGCSWQFGDTPSCLKSGLNTIRCEISGSLRNFHSLPRLLCHADAFHLRSSLFSNFFLTFPSLISLQRLVCLPLPVSPLHLERWHRQPTPTHAPPPKPCLLLCHCVSQGGGGGWLSLPPGLAITQNHLSTSPFDFFQMCHVLTSISLYPNPADLLFVLVFAFLPCLFYMLFSWSSSPHFGNSCLEAHHRFHSLPSSWCLFT